MRTEGFRGALGLLCSVLALSAAFAAESALDVSRPRCRWFWFGDTVTTNGITHDLEAMKTMGLGGATIIPCHWFNLPPGPVKCFSDEWYDCVAWAGKEADRLGLTIGFHNCAGWCNTGGPWVRPEFAQKHLVWTETRLAGGQKVDFALPKANAPFGIYRPVAVLAIPDREESVAFDGPWRDYVFDAPRTVSSAVITLNNFTYGQNGVPRPEYVVSVSDDGQTFREHFRTDRTCAETEHVLTFPAVRAKAVRIAVAKGETPDVKRVEFRAVPCIPHGRRKSFGSYVWQRPLIPQETFPCPDRAAIRLDEVVDLTDRVGADGCLVWDAPSGKWIVLNFGATVMDYAINHVATPAGTGLECDKLSAEGVEEGARGPVTRFREVAERHGIRSFRGMFIDSCEAPSQNWTDRLPEEFAALRGYDLRKYLPAMTGRYVGSDSVSERFLRDFRRTVSDLTIRYWGQHYAKLIHEKGLAFEFQTYNGPFNQIEMGSVCDIPMGEFWVHTTYAQGGNDMTRFAAMQADIYGRRIASAEAFTDSCKKVMTDDNEEILDLKRTADRFFAKGINSLDISHYTHQPFDDPSLRTNFWHFGLRIDRHHPKFATFRPWIESMAQTQMKLQEGRGVADAVVMTREDAPIERADWATDDPYGYRSDVIERKLFLSSLAFRDGRLRLPSGMDFRLLVLPKTDMLTPEVLRKTLELAQTGANVLLGPRPIASPSLTDYPACDREVEALAKALWDMCPEKGSVPVGKGRVWRGVKPIDVYREIGLKPDFAATENGRPVNPDEIVYTHRMLPDRERYFIANVTEKPREIEGVFRSGETRRIELAGSSSEFVDLNEQH